MTSSLDPDHGDPSLRANLQVTSLHYSSPAGPAEAPKQGITAVTKIISPESGFDAYFSLQEINLAIFNHSFPNISSFHEKREYVS